MATLMTKPAAERSLRRMMREPVSLFEEMERLTKEIQERAFNLFEERGGGDGFDLSDWFRAEKELLRPVPIEMEVLEKEVVVRAEVPGFQAAELTITLEPYSVRILGKTEHKETKKEGEKETKERYSEFSRKEAMRQIALPQGIDPDKATARLENGVLEVRMAKAAPAKVVEVKAAA